MSAETDYLQRYIDLKYQIDHDPRFRPPLTKVTIDLGIEITIVEANPCTVILHPDRAEVPSRAPGQKSYALAGSCSLVDATIGIRLGSTGGLEPATMHAALEFPRLKQSVPRYFAYTPSVNPNSWWGTRPFSHREPSEFATVTVSLIPFHRSGDAFSLPVPPDDRVHVHATLRGGRDAGVIVSDVRLDPTTQQLIGYGPRMARQDRASVWLISFFIAPAPPG